MDYFKDRPWVPDVQLTREAADYYRDVYQMHRNRPDTGKCGVCGVYGCTDWQNAYDKLATAGFLMADPAAWRDGVAHRAVNA